MVSIEAARNNSDERWLTTKDAAAHLGYAVQTLYNKLRDIPHHRIGRSLRFRKSELDEWVQRGTESPRSGD